jgi:hypothetical protein
MMSAFWSTHHGQACITANTAAVACAAALLHKRKILAAHTHAQDGTLERFLFPPRDLKGFDTGDFANHGMDALLRLARNGRLQSRMVPDYSWSLLRENRLDVLPGTDKQALPDGEGANLVTDVFRSAKGFYDHVLIDVQSGLETDGTAALLRAADCQMICLNQNTVLLENWFSNASLREQVESKHSLVLLSRYDPSAGCTPGDISRKYGIPRAKLFPIPYSAALMQACNMGTVYDFMARHLMEAKSPERELMAALRQVVEQLEGGTA